MRAWSQKVPLTEIALANIGRVQLVRTDQKTRADASRARRTVEASFLLAFMTAVVVQERLPIGHRDEREREPHTHGKAITLRPPDRAARRDAAVVAGGAAPPGGGAS